MHISPAAIAASLLLAVPLFGQPAPPTPQQLARIRSLAQVHALAANPLSVNLDSREEARQFYRAIYSASNGVPMAWTGNYTTGAAGDTSADYKAATLLRINFFRALVGVPAVITLNSNYSAKDQQAALMMSANNSLSHTPPNTWTFYTADGAEAAGNSNIALGNAGPDAISAYVGDGGSNNAIVGHRRWLFYPQTQQMGTGDVPGNDTLSPANATWVIDDHFNDPRPVTRTTAVPYPPAGYVPYTLVWPRWSFSYPGAEVSATTVTATRDGQALAVASTLASNNDSGEPTLIWVYSGVDANSNDPLDRPSADTTYAVNVNNVLVAGVPQNFSYNVTVFDPDVAGSDYVPVAVTGNAHPVAGAASTYSIAQPTFASGVEWRSLQLAAFIKIYNAEAGLDDLVATTAGGYSIVESAVIGAGTASYNLAHTALANEYLTLPTTFYVGANASITFLSRLGYAQADETALVQISTDDGASWTDAFSQVGTDGAGETNFTSHSVSLSTFAGRTIRIRFAYTLPTVGQAGWFNPGTGVGWYLDNIAFTGLQTATASSATSTGGTPQFAFTPSATGDVGLQARGVLFNTYPLGWGPVDLVTAVAPTSFTTQPVNQTASAGASVSLTAAASGSPTYQWQRDGLDLAGKTTPTLTLANLAAADSGLYSVAANFGAATSTDAIVGVLTSSAEIGDGNVVATSIAHPNGKLYDQVVLTGPAAAVSTQGGRTTRISFIDETDDIVQVEFAGAGTLSLVLDDPSGPANPVNYTQNFAYMKGHVGLVVAGANETTNLLVFTVGRATAFDKTGTYDILKPPATPGSGDPNDPLTNGSPLFVGHAGTTYDGVADIAFIAIASTDGKFGGVRASDARCEAVNGLTGIYAPGVNFAGPVFIGNIDAAGTATPAIVVGSVSDARITGGNLHQTNGAPVQVSGLTKLSFTAGSDSGGHLFPAQQNQAVLEHDGVDVTAQTVVNP